MHAKSCTILCITSIGFSKTFILPTSSLRCHGHWSDQYEKSVTIVTYAKDRETDLEKLIEITNSTA